MALGVAVFAAVTRLHGCCIVPGDFADRIAVRGAVVDGATGQPIAGAILGGSLWREGEVISGYSALRNNGEPNGPATDSQGAFQLGFSSGLSPGCASIFGPRLPPPELGQPDLVTFEIVFGGCTQFVDVEVNEENFVDADASDNTLELRNPILLGPCPVETKGG